MERGAKTVYLILDNIRSVHNVGAIFRTADAAGVSKIYLCGTTPSPIDRFGRKRNDIQKAALGAEESVDWEYFENTEEVVEKLKQENFQVIALEQDKNSVDYKEIELKQNAAVILGPEVTGISKEILDMCDLIAEIPMKGKKESLNVSVATGAFLFRILNI